MNVHFTRIAWDEYLSWKDDPRTATAVNRLINEIRRTPFTGIGKPEPLKGGWQSYWSRRIDSEHRLVYRVEGKGDDQHVTIVICRGHY